MVSRALRALHRHKTKKGEIIIYVQMYIIKKKNKNKIVMFDTLSFRRQRRRRRRLYFFTRTHNRSLTMYISVASSHSYSAHSLSPRTLAICIYRCSRVCRSFIQGVFFSSFLSCLVFFCCWFLLWFYLVSVLSLGLVSLLRHTLVWVTNCDHTRSLSGAKAGRG